MPTPKASTGGKKSKKRDARPARARYWASRTLEKRKVGNLVKCCGMKTQQAYNRWHRERQGRVKDGYLYKRVIQEEETAREIQEGIGTDICQMLVTKTHIPDGVVKCLIGEKFGIIDET